jgi:hypothetical protein
VGGQLIDHSPHSKVTHKQSLYKEENMKTFINRMNWLTAGFYLAFIFIAWLEDDKDKPTKEVKLLGDNEKASSFDEIVKYYEHKENTHA